MATDEIGRVSVPTFDEIAAATNHDWFSSSGLRLFVGCVGDFEAVKEFIRRVSDESISGVAGFWKKMNVLAGHPREKPKKRLADLVRGSVDQTCLRLQRCLLIQVRH